MSHTIRSWFQAPPMSADKYLEENSLVPYWLPRGQQRSHQRWISRNVKHVCLCPKWIRLPTLALKPRRDLTRSLKQGCQWPLQKRTSVLQNFTVFLSPSLIRSTSRYSETGGGKKKHKIIRSANLEGHLLLTFFYTIPLCSRNCMAPIKLQICKTEICTWTFG